MTNLHSVLLLLAAISNQPGGSSVEQSSAAAEKTDPARVESARELMRAMKLERTYESMFKGFAPFMASSTIGLLSANPETKPLIDTIARRRENGQTRLMQLLAEEFLVEARRNYPELIELTAQEYAKAFSAEELRDFIAFYRTSSGIRLIEVQPALEKKLEALGQEIGRKSGEKAAERAFERAESEALTPPATTGS